MAHKMEVRVIVPTQVCDIPEQVQGAQVRFEVSYVSGEVRNYIGRINSVPALFKALHQRLERDASIEDVVVYLPSERILCEALRE